MHLRFFQDKDVVAKVDAAVRSLNAPFADAVSKANTFLLGLQTFVPVEFINMISFEQTSGNCVLRHALSTTESSYIVIK